VSGSGDRPADFRVRCPECGPQSVPVTEVRLVIGLRTTSRGGASGRYTFTCPACGVTVRRPADDALIAVLDAAGVTTLRRV
jgi:predicted RNA-binding Zn-ribbon protein involved in translation (DUF1610 family)